MNADARQLLEQAAALYASMTSYQDVGIVEQHLRPDDPVLRTDFRTLYSRPNLFRFEFSRPHPYPPLSHVVTRHVVGCDGFGAYALRQEYEMPPTLQARRDLSHAVSAVTGLSSGSAHNIARLLLDIDGPSVFDLLQPQLLEEDTVDGMACYCVCAQLPSGGERMWSFESGSRLLRRIRTHRGSVSYDEVHRDIRVNEPLDDALFDIECPDILLANMHEPRTAKPS